jgi:hypothetical protein
LTLSFTRRKNLKSITRCGWVVVSNHTHSLPSTDSTLSTACNWLPHPQKYLILTILSCK